MVPDGKVYITQPLAMRAPEVFCGHACVHRSQIWALAATILHWIKPGILGPSGSPWLITREGWCVARLMRLFPGWAGPPIANTALQCDFEIGKALVAECEPSIACTSSMEDEMQSLGMLPELETVLRGMFVVDPDKRPSAAQVLASEAFLALLKKALADTIG